MATALGHPNRSCVSCKKRKVKCDRKTPSCTACQKSKHKCHYTSYSPQVITDEPQQHNEEDGIKRQKIEDTDGRLRYQRMMAYQPVPIKEEFANPSSYYFDEDDPIYNMSNMNFNNNSVIPATSGGTQFALPQGPQIAQQPLRLPSQHQQIQMSAQQPQVAAYVQYQHPTSTATLPYVQTQNIVVPRNHPTCMKGYIVLNYNVNAMTPLLGRAMAPILQSFTTGQGPNIPQAGFDDVVQLQEWLRERFQSQEWIDEESCVVEPDERFELRPIFEPVNQRSYTVQQKFEVFLNRSNNFVSSPSSAQGGDFQNYEYEEKHNLEMENLTNYSETGSNQSSVVESDPTDTFLNKIYAFVRRFVKSLPWLRDNFMMSLRTKSSPMVLNSFNEGVFSDVIVEVRKVPSYAPYQDIKFISNNQHEEFIKGRLSF